MYWSSLQVATFFFLIKQMCKILHWILYSYDDKLAERNVLFTNNSRIDDFSLWPVPFSVPVTGYKEPTVFGRSHRDKNCIVILSILVSCYLINEKIEKQFLMFTIFTFWNRF